MPIALKPFDPERDFVAQTNFRAGGVIWLRKQPFDKYCVNERVLRQLYEARKIAYDEGEPAAAKDEEPADPAGDLTPEEAHEALLEAKDENRDPDAGAAEPPAEGEDGAGGGEGAAEAPEATESPEKAAGDLPQLDHDGDGEAGGSKPDNEGDPETLIKRLVNRHTHDELFAKASGLKGVTKAMTKAEIAAALVEAGRVGDEPA